MERLIVAIAPIAFFWAASPIVISIVILLLSQEKGIRKAMAYTLPSIVGSIAVGVILVLALRGFDFSLHSRASNLTHAAQFCTAAVFLLIAFLCWWKIPKSGTQMKMPKWVGYLDRVTPRIALVFGLIMFVNNAFMTFAAVLDILVAQVSAVSGVMVVVVFVFAGTMGLWIPVSYRILAPKRSVEGIKSARQWLVKYYRAVLIFEFTFLGLQALAKGIYGLVR